MIEVKTETTASQPGIGMQQALVEDLLQRDESGEWRDQLLESLSQRLGDVKARLDKGLSPEEFKAWDCFRVGLEGAISAVTHCWQILHRDKKAEEDRG